MIAVSRSLRAGRKARPRRAEAVRHFLEVFRPVLVDDELLPGAGPGNRSSATSIGRTISRRYRTASARRGRASRPARTPPTPRSSTRRGSCCCRFSRPARCRPRRRARWSCPCAKWPAALECRIGPADHEGQGAGLRAADATGDRRIEHAETLWPAAAATARAVSTSMVDESISSVLAPTVAEDTARTEIDLADMLTGWQHGDDDLGAGDRRRCARPACRRRPPAHPRRLG